MSNSHHYKINVKWTGNKGTGTSKYDAYERSHVLNIDGKKTIECSSDAPFRGDVHFHNPEDMLLYSLSACHMLWYLHLCADAGIMVIEYTDNAEGTLTMVKDGASKFTEATLHPTIKITDASQIEKAISLHHEAHKKCFIANSCNFEMKHKPIITV
jgi:organic hydroperoxide reductase OsmC/OhrA